VLLTKEKLEMELNIIKTSWASEFDNLTNFPEGRNQNMVSYLCG
jgi:hypothetical protein